MQSARLRAWRRDRRFAQGQFGRAAQARQGRAQVVGDVVHGLAHGADEGLIFVQHRVEQLHHVVQFIVRGRVGTRASRLPVAMMPPAVATIWRTGNKARWAKNQPKTDAQQRDGERYGQGGLPAPVARVSRLLVLRPTTSLEPSGILAPARRYNPARHFWGRG
jgi:hypothetical protein